MNLTRTAWDIVISNNLIVLIFNTFLMLYFNIFMYKLKTFYRVKISAVKNLTREDLDSE